MCFSFIQMESSSGASRLLHDVKKNMICGDDGNNFKIVPLIWNKTLLSNFGNSAYICIPLWIIWNKKSTRFYLLSHVFSKQYLDICSWKKSFLYTPYSFRDSEPKMVSCKKSCKFSKWGFTLFMMHLYLVL